MRFYTLPPRGIPYEYIFVNPRSINELYRREFTHAICDSGVHYFHENPSAKDYPPGYLEKYVKLARGLGRGFADRVWITIPDYPDDYYPGQFGDNVERTLANIAEFVRIADVPWMPTIQANFKNVCSFERCCKEINGIAYFERVAIGTVCKVRDLEFIFQCCRIARKYFPEAWIHAFGPPLNAVPRIMHYINSFDSSAWTFPRSPHNSSCKTARERREYFRAYLSLLSDRQRDTSLLDFMDDSR